MSTLPDSQADLSRFALVDLVALLQELVTGPAGKKAVDMMLANGRTPATVILAISGRQPAPEDDDEARKAITRGDIDYFRGRAIKTRLVAGVVDGVFYDRDTFPGAFAAIAGAVAADRGIA
jgi:hypothetical protein